MEYRKAFVLLRHERISTPETTFPFSILSDLHASRGQLAEEVSAILCFRDIQRYLLFS